MLKGREILYKFSQGWFRGRVLKQATNGTVRCNKRICNYRVFFEDDDELLNQPLYSQTYATDGASAVHSWVLIALPTLAGCMRGALVGPTAAPFALMPPMQ